MSGPRSREERTTHSRHFTWIESLDGKTWSGQRNHTTVVEVETRYDLFSGGRLFALVSRLPGHRIYSKSVDHPQEAMEAADQLFEEWAASMGLSVTGPAQTD